MTRIAFALVLCVALQDDFKTLIEPVRRAKEADRKAAADACRARAGESAPHYVAARFLDKTERQWRLTYDRMKTPGGFVVGTSDQTGFTTLAGQRMPFSAGTALELDVRDPIAGEFDAYLAKFWTGAPPEHRDALEALLKMTAVKSEASEVPRLFALVHMNALGEKAADAGPKLGLVKEGDRWGKRDAQLVQTLSKGFGKAGYVPAEAETKARASSTFAAKYAVTLFDLQRAFQKNGGYMAAFGALRAVPAGAEGHMKALADGLKAAVYCGGCADGKVVCPQCAGKKRLESVKCFNCKGIGWAQKPGVAVGILIKCGPCKQTGSFKNVQCPSCKETGKTICVVCEGKPWRDGFKGCKDCKACDACKGKKEIVQECATCRGRGRVGTSLAGVPITPCDDCKLAGDIKSPCASCSQSGLADCGTCGSKGPRTKAFFKVEDVYTTEPCAACAGRGWPFSALAVPCDRCLGLGVRVVPRLDPGKVLE